MNSVWAQRTNPWLVCILPLAVFMTLTSLEPKPGSGVGAQGSGGGVPAAAEPSEESAASWLPAVPYAWYPLVYTAKVALTALALWFVWPGVRQLPRPTNSNTDAQSPNPDPRSLIPSPQSWLVGVVGAIAWIGICELDLERTWFPRLGLGWMVDMGQRSGFNPLAELGTHPAWAYGFLAIRLFGLVVIVSIAEELFLRGFVTRFIDAPDWPPLPIGQFTWTSAIATTGIAMLTHPGELLAAAVWFSLVSVMVSRTRNLWDAVVAHAVTNLLLGVYVVQTGAWRLL